MYLCVTMLQVALNISADLTNMQTIYTRYFADDEKLNRAIDEVRGLEEEKREAALEEQRAKITELEANIEQLKQTILDSEEAVRENKEATKLALEEVKKYTEHEVMPCLCLY